MSKKRKFASVAATLALAAGVGLVGVSSASAVACNVRSGKTAGDAAWVQGLGDCQAVAVRHYYDPVWSTNNYWTSWSGGTSMLVPYYTPDTPVYIKHSTQAS
ncbi:hypothetical protein [Cellulomonas endometrii]|uniref:hypothetical protein n=1 Tax=Cellulomonas endometrii TaxID=3036301 RepID=UPI0024AC8C40|nr:hypothetical protein [Cellulomonas endometrii]